MAYTKPWNEATPTGAEAANTLDTILQDLQIALRERLADFVPDWADDLVQPKRILPSVAKVEKTGNQSIATGSNVVLTWDAEVFDPDTPTSDPNGLFDSGVDDTIFTVIRDGYYNIVAGLKVDGGTSTWTIRIVKNGTTLVHSGAIEQSTVAATVYYFEISTVASLLDGDTIRIEVFNGDTTPRNVGTGSEFWINMVNNL